MGRDIGGMECKYDRIAISAGSTLYMVSIVAEPMKVKAIRAILAGGAKVQIQADGTSVNRPGDRSYNARGRAGYVTIAPEGYNVWSTRFPYGLVHTLFLARTDGFMTLVNSETLWQELNEPRFTTPLLREWMPYVEAELKKAQLLDLCLSHRAECGLLTATTPDLDKIVEAGLKSFAIKIPQPGVVADDYRLAV